MKFFFCVLLLLLPSLGLTQEGTETPPQEVHAETEDERALRELEANREQRQKAMESLAKMGEGSSGGMTLDPKEQLKNLGYDESMNPSALFSADALKLMEKIILEAKLWEQPEDTIRDQILRSFEGGTLGGHLKNSPRLMSFLVDFMRDKDALLNSIAIFKDRARLKIYLYFWIGIMFASYYTKRLFISKYWKRPVRILAGLMFTLTISLITLSTFGLIFQDELRPIVALVKKHL